MMHLKIYFNNSHTIIKSIILNYRYLSLSSLFLKIHFYLAFVKSQFAYQSRPSAAEIIFGIQNNFSRLNCQFTESTK